jgi:hypothetical protein
MPLMRSGMLFVLLAFLVGGAGGAAARRMMAGRAEVIAASGVKAAPQSVAKALDASPERRATPSSPSITRIVSAKSPSIERRVRDLIFKGKGPNEDPTKPEALRVVFAQWSAKDLAAAADFVLNWRIPFNPEDTERLLKVIVSAWAAKDYKGAFAWAQRVKGFKLNTDLSGIVLGAAIAAGDMPSIGADSFRSLGVSASSLLTTWAMAKPADALAFCARNTGSLHGTDDALMTQLASSHPANELWKMLNDLPASVGRDKLTREFFKHATGIDAVKLALAGVEAGRSLIDPNSVAALRGLNQDQVRELLQGTDQPQWRKALLAKLWQDTGAGMPKEVATAFATVTDPMERSVLLEQAGSMIAVADAERLKWLLPSFSNPEDRAQALDYAVHRAADTNTPERAIELLNRQEDDALRQRGLMTVGDRWDTKDKAATEAWVKQMQPSPERDWAVLGIIAHRAGDDAVGARALLPMLTTPEARNAATMTIAAQWLQKSPANARSWLALQPLTAEQRADVENAARDSLDGAFKPDGGWTGRP